jgi:hypothetical protein
MIGRRNIEGWWLVLGALVAAAAATPCLLPPPLPQFTVEGCSCVSECGSTVDDVYTWDWCYTKGACGTFSYIRGAYWDWCKYDPDMKYESLTAAAKEKYLWGLSAKCTKPAEWPTQAGIFTESVKTSFEDIADIMPASRYKFIHSVGAVATVAFDPSGKPHPFTGLFATGAQHGIIRMSTATPVDATGSSGITPGFALKLLRDGVPSANVVAMPGYLLY